MAPRAARAPVIEVNKGWTGAQGRTVGKPCKAHHPGHGLGNGIEAGALSIGTVLAKTGYGNNDQCRIDFAQPVIIEQVSLFRPFRRIVHDDIELRNKFLQKLLTSISPQV